MKQTVEEAAYQNEQKMLIDADFRVSEEEASYYEGLRDGIIESASKSFIAGVEWQAKQSSWVSGEEKEPPFYVVLYSYGEDSVTFLGEYDGDETVIDIKNNIEYSYRLLYWRQIPKCELPSKI